MICDSITTPLHASSLVQQTVRSTIPLKELTTFLPTTPEVVEQLIQIALSKTSPLDIMLTLILKTYSSEFSKMISNIANRSFEQSQFPTVTKTGLITPLLKNPGLDTADYKNFCPITNFIIIIIMQIYIVHTVKFLAYNS